MKKFATAALLATLPFALTACGEATAVEDGTYAHTVESEGIMGFGAASASTTLTVDGEDCTLSSEASVTAIGSAQDCEVKEDHLLFDPEGEQLVIPVEQHDNGDVRLNLDGTTLLLEKVS